MGKLVIQERGRVMKNMRLAALVAAVWVSGIVAALFPAAIGLFEVLAVVLLLIAVAGLFTLFWE